VAELYLNEPEGRDVLNPACQRRRNEHFLRLLFFFVFQCLFLLKHVRPELQDEERDLRAGSSPSYFAQDFVQLSKLDLLLFGEDFLGLVFSEFFRICN